MKEASIESATAVGPWADSPFRSEVRGTELVLNSDRVLTPAAWTQLSPVLLRATLASGETRLLRIDASDGVTVDFSGLYRSQARDQLVVLGRVLANLREQRSTADGEVAGRLDREIAKIELLLHQTQQRAEQAEDVVIHKADS